MNDKDRLNLYKEIYDNQIDRYNEIQNKLLIHFAALILFVFNLDKIFKLPKNNPVILKFYIISIAIFIYIFIKIISFYYNTWKGKEYYYIAKSKKIENLYQEYTSEKAENFTEELINHYTELNDKNFINNKNVEQNLQKTKLFSLFLLVNVFIYNIIVKIILF
jgi:hypothetical protein